MDRAVPVRFIRQPLPTVQRIDTDRERGINKTTHKIGHCDRRTLVRQICDDEQ
jgi:hypothetical protein